MENAPRKLVQLDPLSLPYLAAVAEEQSHPAIALSNRIEALQAELKAAEWRRGTLWWCDREYEMRLNLTTLARISPGHPALPSNVISM